jgi:hypothetical protein
LVATLSILVSFSKALEIAPPVWLYLSVSFSIASLVVSVFTYAKTRIKKYSIPAVHLDERIGKIERRIKVITVAVILVAIVVVCTLIIYLQINNLLPF